MRSVAFRAASTFLRCATRRPDRPSRGETTRGAMRGALVFRSHSVDPLGIAVRLLGPTRAGATYPRRALWRDIRDSPRAQLTRLDSRSVPAPPRPASIRSSPGKNPGASLSRVGVCSSHSDLTDRARRIPAPATGTRETTSAPHPDREAHSSGLKCTPRSMLGKTALTRGRHDGTLVRHPRWAPCTCVRAGRRGSVRAVDSDAASLSPSAHQKPGHELGAFGRSPRGTCRWHVLDRTATRAPTRFLRLSRHVRGFAGGRDALAL